VTALAFGNDGRKLASGGEDGQVRIWDVQAKQELGSIPAQRGSVDQILFAPQNETLCVGAAGSPVRLISFVSGRETVRLPNRGKLNAIAISHDGQWLAIGSGAIDRNGVEADGNIQIWNIGVLSRDD